MQNILTAQNIYIEQFESYKSLRQEKALKTIDRLQSTQKACHHAFSYVGDISTIRDAVQLLSRNKFHETFQAINDHFINLGISNIARFEHEARAYTLQIGQDVQHHIENLREAIQRWMMMELLEREMRRPNPLSMSSLTISPTNSVVSTHATSTAILKSVLSQKEICDFNSYDVEDFRIESLHFPVLLPERKRFEIYLRSISASASNRFRAVIDEYSRARNSDQTVLKLLSSLHQQESSLVGQATLAAEREASSKWQSLLHSYLDGVRGTDPSPVIINPHSKVSAHVAFSGDNSTSSSLRCANPKHSKCSNHDSKDCKAEPWHSMWIKGLLNAATGLPLDGSALPASIPSRPPSVPPIGSPPKNPKDLKKSKYQGSPCTFCQSKPDLQKCAPTHSIDTCRIKDKYVPRSGKPSATANVAQIPTIADLSAHIAQLTSNVQKLSDTVGKKRKHEEGEI